MIARTWRQPAKHKRPCAKAWKHESDSGILCAFLLSAGVSGGCPSQFRVRCSECLKSVAQTKTLNDSIVETPSQRRPSFR